MNLVILCGNLGRDPELTYTQSGTAKCKFSVATSSRIKNKAGDYEEKTCWHNIVVWGAQAEACGKFLAKGRKVLIHGEIDNRSYEDKDGVTKYISEVNAQRVEFLGGDKSDRGAYDGQAGGQDDPPPRQQSRGGGAQTSRQSHNGPRKPATPPPADFNDDDIPF